MHTDRKNLSHAKMASDLVMRWRLALEELREEFQHVEGKENVIADALSRSDANFPEDSETKQETMNACWACRTSKSEERETDFLMCPLLTSKQQRKHNQLKKSGSSSDNNSEPSDQQSAPFTISMQIVVH